MKSTVKKLMEMEQVQLSKRLNNNMGYIGYYMLMIIVCLIALLIGMDRGLEMKSLIWMWGWMFMVGISCYIGPIISVMEKGQGQNVFLKYIYVPVSLKDLLHAKLAIIGKRIGKSAFVAQWFAIAGMGIDLEMRLNEGEVINVTGQEIYFVFSPLWVGIVVFLLFVLRLYPLYKEALKG